MPGDGFVKLVSMLFIDCVWADSVGAGSSLPPKGLEALHSPRASQSNRLWSKGLGKLSFLTFAGKVS